MIEQREREDRQTEEAAQRRRRSDDTIDGSQRLKLAIPPEVAARLKEQGRTPRWAVKGSARMLQLTEQDDYDPVEGVQTVPTRSLSDGSPIEMMLLSKPTAFIAQDRAKADKPRVDFEEALMRGKNPQDPTAGNDSFYADPANKLKRGGSG